MLKLNRLIDRKILHQPKNNPNKAGNVNLDMRSTRFESSMFSPIRAFNRELSVFLPSKLKSSLIDDLCAFGLKLLFCWKIPIYASG